MIKYILIAIFSGLLSAFSQILLKISSNKAWTGVRQYLNVYVICGYTILIVCMFLMIIAYKGLPFKYGAIIESLSYFYIFIFSKIFFKEKTSKKGILGILFIVLGVMVFNL